MEIGAGRRLCRQAVRRRPVGPGAAQRDGVLSTPVATSAAAA